MNESQRKKDKEAEGPSDEEEDFCLVIPLCALVDFKSIRIRVSTLTSSRHGSVVWGFDENLRHYKDSGVKDYHLEKLAELLHIQTDSEFLFRNIDQYKKKRYGQGNEYLKKWTKSNSGSKKSLKKRRTTRLSAKQLAMAQKLSKATTPKGVKLKEGVLPFIERPYEFCLSPKLLLYRSRLRTLEDFQANRIKGPSVTQEITPIIYVVDTGPLYPIDCNFYYNCGISLMDNLRSLQKNEFKSNFLEMTEGTSAYEKYRYRLGSEFRDSKYIRDLIIEEALIDKNRFQERSQEPELDTKRGVLVDEVDSMDNLGLEIFENPYRRDFSKMSLPSYYRYQSSLMCYLDQNLTHHQAEFDVTDYCESPLPTDPRITSMTKLSKKLYFEKIPQLISYLEDNAIFPLNSNTLKNIFYRFGVNLRHLGIVARNTKIHELRLICVEEMLARTITRIFYSMFAEKFLQTDTLNTKLGKYAKKSFTDKDFVTSGSSVNPLKRGGSGSNKADSVIGDLFKGEFSELKKSVSNSIKSKDNNTVHPMRNDGPQLIFLTDFLEQFLKMKGKQTADQVFLWERM